MIGHMVARPFIRTVQPEAGGTRQRADMLGQIVESAAALADEGSPTVDAALARYRLHRRSPPSPAGQVWVSVAFLLDRQDRLAPASRHDSKESLTRD